MNHAKFSTIAHTDLAICGPVSQPKVTLLLSLMELTGTNRPILDIGCGKGTWLLQTCQLNPSIRGVGVDLNAAFLELARQAAQQTALNATFIQQSIADYPLTPESHSAIICMGASQAYGGYRQTLSAAMTLLASGGYLLMGEGYWKQAPAQEYLDFLGAQEDEQPYHAGNVAMAEAAGFITLYTTTSTADEWDFYEGHYKRAVERYVRQNPHDPDSPAMAERIRAWNGMYHKHGRDTLGFGCYLLQKP